LTALAEFNLPTASADIGEAPDPGGLITPENKKHHSEKLKWWNWKDEK